MLLNPDRISSSKAVKTSDPPFIRLSPSANQLNQVYAIDPLSGKIVWNLAVEDPKGGKNRLIVSPDGTLFIPSHTGTLIRCDGKNGKVLWQRQYNVQGMFISQSGNILYMVTQPDDPEREKESQKTGLTTREIWALSSENGEILWKVELPRNHRWWYPPVIGDKKIYLWDSIRLVVLREPN